jgi:DDE family transposase
MRSNQAADAAPDVLRVSLDAKATVKIGPFARGGKSRVQVAAADHDFAPAATVTPVGLFLPAWDAGCVYSVPSKGTSDCLVDRLTQWWESVRERFAPITTLVINLDNAPENHSRRTPCMQRMVTFVRQYHLHVRLVFPPVP